MSGTTDLRGVFVGNCPAAAATIVAQAGSGRYAYFASPPPASDARGAIAGTRPPEDDPTAPFEGGRQPIGQPLAVNGPAAASAPPGPAPAIRTVATACTGAATRRNPAIRRSPAHRHAAVGADGAPAGSALAAAGPQRADLARRPPR